MANRDDIKKAIMDVAGNPKSGTVMMFVDAWADAIIALDLPIPAPAVHREDEAPIKETRVMVASEKR
tara:strand:- start:1159 stop:1359 length:201 start_codon:yes stop_codon:yes gene_type:complete